MCQPVYGDADKLYKAFVVIYTCLSTRAVVLEVVHNATASTFINSLRRFIFRRGCPEMIISDNGSVYRAEITQEFATHRGIKWKFITEGAPWKGGAWERLVASVKRCLKKVIGIKKVTYVELQTLIVEIELVLNNRPIGVDYDDDLDTILTPNHLLFGRRLESSNEEIVEDNDNGKTNLIKRRKFMNIILNHFWQRWRKEYLTSLREVQRVKIKQRSAKIALGDIVIVYDEKQPRHLWQMGRVTNLIAGNDEVIRSASVKMGKSGCIINRPVNKLYPILRNTEEDLT